MAQNPAAAFRAAYWLVDTVSRLVAGNMGVKAGGKDWCDLANALPGQLRAAEQVIVPLLPDVEELGLPLIECGDLSERTGFMLVLKLGRYVEGILNTGSLAPTAEERLAVVLQLLGGMAIPKLVEWNRLRSRLELEADALNSTGDGANRNSPAEGNTKQHDTVETDAKTSAEAGPMGSTEDDKAERNDVATDLSDLNRDDKLPAKQRKLSPSRINAKATYDWAMSNVSGAEDMTIAELYDAIECHPSNASEALPPNAETFGKYLRDAGVRIYNKLGKSAGKSVQRSDEL